MDIKRYTMPEKKPGKRAGYALSRQCPGCGQNFPLSQLAWLGNPNCFLNNSPECPLVKAQSAWIQSNPTDTRLQSAENLYQNGQEKTADKVINQLLDDILGV